MLRTIALSALALIPVAASATVITPTGYTYTVGPNSSGSAYEDDTYNGTTGQLTDGVSATLDWHFTDGGGAAGPNVGWLNVNPVIVFTFDQAYDFGTMIVNMQDGKGAHGVGLANSITVNGLTSPTLTGNGTTDITGWDVSMDLSALAPTDTLSVTVNRGFQWTFLSEFTFNTATSEVPLPAGLPLLLLGLGSIAALRRRKAGHAPRLLLWSGNTAGQRLAEARWDRAPSRAAGAFRARSASVAPRKRGEIPQSGAGRALT
ncbi:VPLPA-CTERM sorting domain-containing protein [Tropicibacter sp. S64]|uniref:VPLPA-CTERM sorting domain-containing protein n=1 Tax=Tropicibacter sp. S64 TaxID=3415122 RepID=UPI003C7A664B